MAQTLFKLIKINYPGCIIDVLSTNWTGALLDRMPEINKYFNTKLKHGELKLRRRHEIGKSLKDAGYSQAIVLPNSFKSALIPFFAKIPKRTGWRGEFRYGLINDIRILDKTKYRLMIERFMALSLSKNSKLPKYYPYPELQISKDNLKAALQRQDLLSIPSKFILALCPGAKFGKAKRWLPEYFAKIANAKLDVGWKVWLFGGADDNNTTQLIQDLTNNRCLNLAGKTSLADAIDLLSLAKVVVTNDSGLMHVSAALNIPLVAIYGSSSPEFTPPLSKNVKILSLNLDCSPCFKRNCPLGHYNCLKKLKPEIVLSAITSVMDKVYVTI